MPRLLLAREPFADAPAANPWERGRWPAQWIAPTRDAHATPQVLAFRLRVEVREPLAVRLHVSADERYELYLDGVRLGRGPERGDLAHWRFETYAEEIPRGVHLLVARVWWLGQDMRSPFAQMTLRPAFLCAAEGCAPELFNTGMAAWEVQRLDGYQFLPCGVTWGAGGRIGIDGQRYPWGIERGRGSGWSPAVAIGLTRAGSGRVFVDGALGWFLTPAALPPQRADPVRGATARAVEPILGAGGDAAYDPLLHLAAEATAWDAVLEGRGSVTLPPQTRRRVLIDWHAYVTGYWSLTLSGGAGSQVALRWAESLYEDVERQSKGNRDAIAGKFMACPEHRIATDGGAARTYAPLWWDAGRYLELTIDTVAAPLTVAALRLEATGYPWQWTGSFTASDPRLERISGLMLRTLEACTHETFMDCPYYEQLQYVGDTRLQILACLVRSSDDRLARQALLAFDHSRGDDGLTQSRYPCFAKQVIPPFSLWWIGMVRDWWWWRDAGTFTRDRLPGVRAVIDAYHRCRTDRGLIASPQGWNYLDWTPGFSFGMPPDGDTGGVSGPLCWQYALALTEWADLEAAIGEPELAALADRRRAELVRAIDQAFWDESRGLYADDAGHAHFSEHAQCLAVLTGTLAPERRARIAHGLRTASDLSRTTIYFSHYLFEAYRELGMVDLLRERLQLWLELPAMGLCTTLEGPEPSRSDCHAWGAHPLFHFAATLLGVRPGSAGFATVAIRPQLGGLTHVRGSVPHPLGMIQAEFHAQEGGTLSGWVDLPPGLSGEVVLGTTRQPLAPGRTEVRSGVTGGGAAAD